MGTVGFDFEVLNKADVPSFQQALAARSKAAIAAGGKDGTVGRFLARNSGEAAACSSSPSSIGKGLS